MTKAISAVASILLLSVSAYFLSPELFGTHEAQQEPENVQYYQTKCPTGTSDAGYSIQDKPVCDISNIISNDLNLTNDKFWHINGEVQIGGDNNYQTKLTIGAGTLLFGNSSTDFMVVNRGSQIIAQGTKKQPIVFTSESDLKNNNPQSGDWGGLVIAGNGPINTGNFDEQFEFSKRKIRFGGDNYEDNSGVLKYVVIKYAGAQVVKDKELNGLSLGGVGSGTTIDYVEVYKGKDDGIELWGGTVNMKHILLIGNRDDSLDTDMGYNGYIQYLYAEKFSVESSETGSGIESDNNENNFAATPVTNPVLVNFEFVGSSGSKYGIMIRRGSGYTLINGIVSGFDKAQLSIRNAQTLENDSIFMRSVALDATEEDGDLYAAKSGVTELDVKEIFTSCKYCKVGAYTTKASIIKSKMYDSFFDQVAYVGAYEKGEDWRLGWSEGVYTKED